MGVEESSHQRVLYEVWTLRRRELFQERDSSPSFQKKDLYVLGVPGREWDLLRGGRVGCFPGRVLSVGSQRCRFEEGREVIHPRLSILLCTPLLPLLLFMSDDSPGCRVPSDLNTTVHWVLWRFSTDGTSFNFHVRLKENKVQKIRNNIAESTFGFYYSLSFFLGTLRFIYWGHRESRSTSLGNGITVVLFQWSKIRSWK